MSEDEKEMENNMDVEIELEKKRPAFVITASILHILDYSSHQIILSDTSLNLEDTLISRLIMRFVRRVHRNPDAHVSHLGEEQPFTGLLDAFTRNEITFTDFSRQTAELFDEVLKGQSVKTIDLFINAYHYDDVPYVSLLFLEGQSSLAPRSGSENGLLVNTIEEKRGILPAAGKKISSYAVIQCLSHEVHMNDEIKWDTENKDVLQSVLGGEMKESVSEVLTSLTEIADEVAQDYEANPTITVAKTKHAIDKAVKEERPVAPEVLAEEIFPGEENQPRKEAFIQKARQKSLPEEVEVEPAALRSRMKKQKITTDTGIEISFPSEYGENPEMISFDSEEDGSISISIHHIGHITNKS